ncbi:MAG: DUF1624 domain-containing protein [Ruminococcaceae bacterium]|nr:DUF1624 domain-containing protein [Oscillospiraceae bacterium]
MPADRQTKLPRIAFLDEVRGLCCLLMVIHHAFYTAGYIFGAQWGRWLFDFFAAASPFFAGIFILLCGICCRFSRSNLKRGLLLAAVSVGMSVLFWHISPQWGGYIGVKGLLSWDIPAAWQVQRWLFPLGIGIGESADYFPLLQWIGVFFGGVFLGRWAKEGRFPRWMNKSRLPLLGKVGNYTLWVYVAHQPILYGLFWCVFSLFSL